MGNTLSTKKRNSIQKNEIKAEWNKKKQDRIFLFIGDIECGKTKFIEELLRYGSYYDIEEYGLFESITELNSSEQRNVYHLNMFTINEYYYNIDISSAQYKHLNVVLNNIKIDKERNLNYNIEKPLIFDDHNKQLLILGYYKNEMMQQQQSIPIGIVQLISKYILNLVITSYIYPNSVSMSNSYPNKNDPYFEFWNASVYDINNLHVLYKYIHGIIFEIDVSNNDTNSSIDLFECVMKKYYKMKEKEKPIIFVILNQKNNTANDCSQIEIIKQKFNKLAQNYCNKIFDDGRFQIINENDKDDILKAFYECEGILNPLSHHTYGYMPM